MKRLSCGASWNRAGHYGGHFYDGAGRAFDCDRVDHFAAIRLRDCKSDGAGVVPCHGRVGADRYTFGEFHAGNQAGQGGTGFFGR